ncbi:MAG: hypothetical protein M3Q28_05275 [Pseudomonadota bacterium]|nr:hypothetical protein [Pseudomonadota bacterium]
MSRPSAVGAVQFGELRRARPLGQCYGFDRGQPIDSYYKQFELESSGGSTANMAAAFMRAGPETRRGPRTPETVQAIRP